MDRLIATDSVDLAHADTAPVSGTPEYATSGDPGAGTPATVFPAYAFNAIQEELIAIIVAGGGTPDRTNNAQVLAALRQLIQDETGNYAVDTGAANVYVIAPNPPIGSYTDGLPLRFLILNANTGASTIAVSGLAAKQIVRVDGTALQAGDLPAGGIASILYSVGAGGKFFLISTQQQNLSTLQAQAGNYGADTGADTTHFGCTLAPVLAAHVTGMPIRIKAAHDCGGASLFNPGPGAVAIQDMDGNALTAGAFKTGAIIELKYTGTVYQLCSVRFATAAEMTAAAQTQSVVSPGQMINSPFTAKAWVTFSYSAGTSTFTGKNVTAVNRSGAGVFTFTLAGVTLQMGNCVVNSNKAGVPLASCSLAQVQAGGTTVGVSFFTLATSPTDPDFATIVWF